MGRLETLNAARKSVAVLVADGEVAGLIAMRDEPRDDAKAGLKDLADAGVRTMMLTATIGARRKGSAGNWGSKCAPNCCRPTSSASFKG